MKRAQTLLIWILLFATGAINSQKFYTQNGTDPSFQSLLSKGTIKTGRNTIPNVPASTINVNNKIVEVGPYAQLSIPKEINIHTLTSSVIARNNFSKMKRWYQEDGNTQVFRLFKGEHNVRNSRKGAARIEAFSKTKWKKGAWHEWVGTYTVVKPIKCAIFQAKNNKNDWSFQLNLTTSGDIGLNHRTGQSDKIIAKNMTGKNFHIRVRDNGYNYEVFLNGKKVGAGTYSRPAGETSFRWGMYTGKTPSVTNDALLFVTGATIDGKNIKNPTPPTTTPTPTPNPTPTPTPTNNTKPVVNFAKGNQTLVLGYKRFSVEANASDADGSIQKVELFVDNKLIRVEKVAPYEWGKKNYATELEGLSIGKHVFKVIATDTKGAIASDSFELTITKKKNNTPVSSKLSVNFVNTKKTINKGYKRFSIKANATTQKGSTISRIKLYINNKLIRAERNAPYQWGQGKFAKELLGLNVGKHTFKVEAIDNKGRKATDTFVLNVEKKGAKAAVDLNKEIILYPNPATKTLNINGIDQTNTLVTISNLQGKIVLNTVLKKNQKLLNIDFLNDGMYFITLAENDGFTITKTFIKR